MNKIEKYQKALTALNNNVAPDVMLKCSQDDVITIDWKNTTPIEMSVVEQKVIEIENNTQAEIEAKEALKSSAKTKLINGEPLTEEEANTIVI